MARSSNQLIVSLRTVLYHPLTPFFVLFCNVVATSNAKDFDTLERVTDELEGLVGLSTSIAKLQTLFKSFIELCEGLVSEKRQRTCTFDTEADFQASRARYMPLATSQSLSYAPSNGVPASSSGLHDLLPTNVVPFEAPDTEFVFTSSNTHSSLDPGWGLFDVQPTLDWLDADFSLFVNEAY